MKKYIGQIIFVESKNKNSTYHNGEYLVLLQSPNNIFGVKLAGGYQSHEIQTIPITGKDGYKVINSEMDLSAIKDFIQRQEDFVLEKDGKNRRWVESVYTEADAVLKQVKKLYYRLSDEKPLQLSIPSSTKNKLLNILDELKILVEQS